jgi:hypothetical protein
MIWGIIIFALIWGFLIMFIKWIDALGEELKDE